MTSGEDGSNKCQGRPVDDNTMKACSTKEPSGEGHLGGDSWGLRRSPVGRLVSIESWGHLFCSSHNPREQHEKVAAAASLSHCFLASDEIVESEMRASPSSVLILSVLEHISWVLVASSHAH